MAEATPTLTAFEQRILELGKAFPKGIPDKVLKNDSPEVPGEERVEALNRLLELNLLDLYRQPHNNELLYKLKTKTTQEDTVMKNADREEQVVYDIIKDAGNIGIWIKEIRNKSNLAQASLTKLLKNLETKKLVKTVKSVAQGKKKVYMLFDLEPHRSVTGGIFFSDQDFDSDFARILNMQCSMYLSQMLTESESQIDILGPLSARMKALVTPEQVTDHIRKSNLVKVEITKEDVESILQTVVYDGAAERIVRGNNVYYVAARSFIDPPGITSMPCGVCPVFKDCTPHGIINPRDCEYYTDWLAGVHFKEKQLETHTPI